MNTLLRTGTFLLALPTILVGLASCTANGPSGSTSADPAHTATSTVATAPIARDGIIVQYHVPVPMRDGVVLSATVYRPVSDQPAPVVLSRTPYNKSSTDEGGYRRRKRFLDAGYAWVDVDVRGRGDSGGTFRPFLQEGVDGYDTVEWAGTQPWSTGKVGTVGGSYGGYTQWVAAVRQPPHLAAMVPTVACPDPFVDGLLMGPTGLPGPISVSWYQFTSGRLNQESPGTPWAKVFTHAPMITLDDAAGIDLPFWNEMIEHAELSPWWDEARYQNQLDAVQVPTLSVSGWYDDEHVSTLTNFRGVSQSSASGKRASPGPHHLLMGAWPHGVNNSTRIGSLEFGPTSRIDMDGRIIRFFDRWLKGELNGAESDTPVRIFVMGENVWRDEAAWPIPRTVFTPYYLGGSGPANGDSGNGALSATGSIGTPNDSFTFDPAVPVPFLTDPKFSQVGGPDDYREINKRTDVLCYTTPPMAAPLELCGPVAATIWAITDAPDTDFTCRLTIIRADGTQQRLCDGIVRARFRNGMENPTLITPGEPIQYTIDCWSTCQTFMPGERIGVQISSSSFPQWNPNPNTGERLGFETTMRPANQVILHDAAHPSFVTLPVVPAK